MADVWIYVVGGIIVALIAFTIAYNLLVAIMDNAERQSVLQHFSSFYTDVNIVCLQEIGNSKMVRISLPSLTRVIYATDDAENPLVKVVDPIKNGEISTGNNLCLQFKDEQYIRCYPEKSEILSCKVFMPHLGVLPETEDIWVKVNKILGNPIQREYMLLIQKTGSSEVNVSLVS